MKKITFAILFAALLASLITSTAFADSRQARAANTEKSDNMLYVAPVSKLELTHTEEDEDEISCNSSAQFPAPVFADYLDGDTDPETAYNDYLEDLGGWVVENNICDGIVTLVD
jgi:hypothetical protein